jgi:hypothetical protein
LSNTQVLQILFPIGRLVQGSLTEMQDKDADGKPLTIKNGPNAGQPTKRSFFAVAIAKVPGHTHWTQTDWGRQMWDEAAKAWPQGQSGNPAFAFKVEDGDSPVPNMKGRKNCDRPGFPGCWILNFGSGYPVKVVTADGTAAYPNPASIKLGHFVEAFGSYVSNNSAMKPGMYLNHAAVGYSGYGEEIHVGIDTSKVGFGKGVAPAGMSATPPPALNPANLPPAAGAAPGAAPPIPGAVIPPATGIPPIPGAAAAAAPPTAVAPAAPFILPAAAPPPPPPAAPAPPPAGPVTTTGIPYASYISQGWTHAQMLANGVVTA